MQKLALYPAAAWLPSLMLFMFLTVIGQNAAAICSVNETDDGHTLIIEDGLKKVALIGWAHPNEIAVKQRVDQFNKFLAHPKRSCEAFASLVTIAFINDAEDVNFAVSAYRRMIKVPFANSGVTIGAEMSQKEMDEHQALDEKGKPKDFFNLANVKATYDILTRAAAACPDIEPEIANYALYLLNPEYAIWADSQFGKRPVQIRGFDDYESRQEVFNNSSSADRTFDPAKVDLAPSTRLVLFGLAKRYHDNLEGPSDRAIEDAIAPIKDSETSYKVSGYLRAMQLIAGTLQRRNQKIIENIMNTPGNVIMNVGEDHIRGLKAEFERMCVNEAKQSPAIVPTKVQVKPITKDPAG